MTQRDASVAARRDEMRSLQICWIGIVGVVGACAGTTKTTQEIPAETKAVEVTREAYVPESELAALQEKGLKYCQATIASSGDGVGLLRCGQANCVAEYPAGRVDHFECKDGTTCPRAANVLYAEPCDKLNFNSGCSVTYSPVTPCK
jgi:hypothetical protein